MFIIDTIKEGGTVHQKHNLYQRKSEYGTKNKSLNQVHKKSNEYIGIRYDVTVQTYKSENGKSTDEKMEGSPLDSIV